jgi:hypothetical protein
MTFERKREKSLDGGKPSDKCGSERLVAGARRPTVPKVHWVEERALVRRDPRPDRYVLEHAVAPKAEIERWA